MQLVLVVAGKAVGVMQFGGLLGKLALGYISNWAMKSKVNHCIDL
jgi:hypothetical protein